MKQPDLFDWRPPCRMLVFPHARRVGRVQRVASVLLEKKGRSADAYWRRTVDTLVGQMERAGLPKQTIRAEIEAFFDAVQAELIRQNYFGHGTGDAA